MQAASNFGIDHTASFIPHQNVYIFVKTMTTRMNNSQSTAFIFHSAVSVMTNIGMFPEVHHDFGIERVHERLQLKQRNFRDPNTENEVMIHYEEFKIAEFISNSGQN